MISTKALDRGKQEARERWFEKCNKSHYSKRIKQFRRISIIIILTLLTLHTTRDISQASVKVRPGHYIFMGAGLERSSWPVRQAAIDIVKSSAHFQGVQIVYQWKDIETTQGVYDFSFIDRDLNYLKSIGKNLQIQFVVGVHKVTPCDANTAAVPAYIIDPAYDGGVTSDAVGEGCYAKEWNDTVAQRQVAAIQALGQKYNADPSVTGINTDETAFGGGSTGVGGYDPVKFVANLKKVGSAMGQAFPDKLSVVYINFIPGANTYQTMKDIMTDVAPSGTGIGGPDTDLVDIGLGTKTYQVAREVKNQVPVAYAVQYGNWTRNGGQTAQQMYDFLETNFSQCHIWWSHREPYFTQELLPLVNANPQLVACDVSLAPTATPHPIAPTATPAPIVPTATVIPASTTAPTTAVSIPTFDPTLGGEWPLAAAFLFMVILFFFLYTGF